jgi:hypothetical protein
VELRVPLAELGLEAGNQISLFVELFARGQSLDRTPAEGTIDLRVPSADFEAWNWQA